MPKPRHKALPGPHEKLLARSGQIGLAISSYDDLFSDFDPRSYKERRLSEDFLTELRRFFFDKNPESVNIILLMPSRRRSAKTEVVIKKRFHIYFQKQNREIQVNLHKSTRRNFLKTLLSLCLMVATGYLATKAGQVLWMNIVKVVVEPASWFLFWTSLEQLLTQRRARAKDLRYFRRLSECKIIFLSI